MISNPIAYGNFSDEFIAELSEYLKDQKVLEINAGNGLLARKLSNHSINITPTSLFSGHDGHQAGMNFDVKEIEACAAVLAYQNHDVLLTSWPTTGPYLLKAAKLWGSDKDIIFIGEYTILEENKLGGCADDAFFASVQIIREFKSYKGNMLEKAVVLRLKN